MDVISKAEETVTMSATTAELARLAKLLDWIIDNKSVMDDGMILLQEEEITPSIKEWTNFIDPLL